MNSGEIIARTLKLYGIDHFFAFTGADQDLWLGLRNEGIKHILPHSERSGVAMADAYSRITGQPSFTYGQFGPGAALCVSGMADAFWGKSPVICITSKSASSGVYRHSYQEISDQGSLFRPITKWSGVVPNLARLPDILRSAIRVAVSGVPGPVHLDIPAELTFFTKEDIKDVGLYAEPEFKRYPACRIAPSSSDIQRVMETIMSARRPLILAGGGIIASEAWTELIEFAEMLSIPVVTSSAGKGAILTNHPLAVGVVGNYSRKVANAVVSQCDTYIVIGSDLGDHTTKSRGAPEMDKQIIHIDLDPAVLGTNYKETISMVGDAKLVLKGMIEAADSLGISKKPCAWQDWVTQVKSMVASWQKLFCDLCSEGGSEWAVSPYFIMSELNRVIGPDDIVVADTGYMAAYANTCVDVNSPGRKHLRTAGTLGWGFPASLGAQLAAGSKSRVFCIAGDGGFGYHVGEIETALRYGLPVIVLLMNNSSLSFEYHIQKILYKDIVPGANDFLDVDYSAVARAFGAFGENVTNPEAVRPALNRALESGKLAVLNFRTNKEIYAPVIYYEGVEDRQV